MKLFKNFKSTISHHFVALDMLIFKMQIVWGFQILFHKIIEETGKKYEKSSPNK